MKLIECHIAGFGPFKDCKLSFDDGLNVILQPNGWGKTSLSAYIKAMLYGFERKRVRDVSENERLRYKPWSGGKYGGTLDFEFDGREYRILREFGATGAGDTLKVIEIETGKPVEFNGEEVGDWVFGLDSNAFQKSVFVGQNGFGFDGSTAGLRNRLNALVNEADDVAGLDKAQSALDARRKFYKKTGNRGYIADVSSNISKLVERQKGYDSQISQMGMLQERMSQLDSSISDAADRETELQKRIDAAQSGEKNAAALNAAHDQLTERCKAAADSYREYVGQVGKVPAEADLEVVRKTLDVADLSRKEIGDAHAAIDAAGAAKNEIASKYAGRVPLKAEIDERRKQLAELAHQLEVIGLSGLSAQREYAFLDEAVDNDPSLLSRADTAISSWPGVESGLNVAKTLRQEIEKANAIWTERRANILKIKGEADEANSLVPEDAENAIENCRRTAVALRAAAKERQSAEARIDSLKSQIESAKEELGSLADSPQASDADLNRVDEGVATCKIAASELQDAKKAAAAEDSKLAVLKAAKEKSLEAVQAAQSAVASAEVEKAKALSDSSAAKVAMAEASQAKRKNPAPAIACIVAGAIAAVAGFVLGPAATFSYVAYAIAAVLIIAGIVLLAKKPAGDSEAIAHAESAAKAAAELLSAAERKVSDAERKSGEANADATKAASELDAQGAVVSQATERVRAASKADRDAKTALVRLLSSLLPFEDLDLETVAAQAPLFKSKLAERSRKLQRIAELSGEVTRLQSSIEDATSSAVHAMQAIGLALSEDLSVAADAAIEKANELEAAMAKAQSANDRLGKAIAEASGKTTEQMTGEDYEAMLGDLDCEMCPGMENREAQALEAERDAATFAETIDPLLRAFSVEHDDDTTVEVERLSSAVAAYRSYKADMARAVAETAESRKAVDELSASLDGWAKEMGLNGREALTADAFDAMSADATLVERLDWDAKKAAEKADAATANLRKLDLSIKQFLLQYGVDDTAPAREAIDKVVKQTKRCKELANEAAVAQDQLSAWEEKHSQELSDAKSGAAGAQVEQAKLILASVQSEHESRVAERAQAEEKRNAILQSLEGYLTCAQELRLLAQQKQDATAKLFTVQKTAEYLSKARANLDGRYLGGLTDRFNDYAASWLEGEGLDVTVGGDFDVAVSDGGAPHSVASYSTGYQDLLDICLRMALVDTVFENEEPFIVMDDPFVNLDQEKIGRAMLLLALLAQKKQIIYFTCHPSRMEADDGDQKVAFTLPEQRESREMPRARAMREAEERARAQAELVASYHVEPVTQGRAAVRVSGSGRSITNNMFNVRFEVDPDSGRRDNAFEVHFIDEKYRALCERQIVEVIDGRVVPERLRFCLTTRDDSGNAYDLIIHEQDKPEADLAARITYKADISFNTEDFDF